LKKKKKKERLTSISNSEKTIAFVIPAGYWLNKLIKFEAIQFLLTVNNNNNNNKGRCTIKMFNIYCLILHGYLNIYNNYHDILYSLLIFFFLFFLVSFNIL